MLSEGFCLFFKGDLHWLEKISHVICFSLWNIIMKTISKIDLNQHFKTWKQNKAIEFSEIKWLFIIVQVRMLSLAKFNEKGLVQRKSLFQNRFERIAFQVESEKLSF